MSFISNDKIKINCSECKKPLTTIKDDWKKRHLHKSCWVKKNEREELLEIMQICINGCKKK